MMNERIEKLGEQADLLGEFTPTKIPGRYVGYITEEQILKFAELIVRECLNMCADSDAALQRIRDRETSPDSEYVRYGAADYEYAAAYGKQIDHYESIADKATYAGDKIREHFGVD